MNLLDLENVKNNTLDAKIGVDTAENEPNMLMAYELCISISYLQARPARFVRYGRLTGGRGGEGRSRGLKGRLRLGGRGAGREEGTRWNRRG